MTLVGDASKIGVIASKHVTIFGTFSWITLVPHTGEMFLIRSTVMLCQMYFIQLYLHSLRPLTQIMNALRVFGVD